MQQASWYIEKLKSPFAPLKRWVVRQLAAREGPRVLLSRYYGSPSFEGKSRFEQQYSQVFRSRGLLGGEGVPMSPGDWTLRFVDREIRLPLRPAWAWLDWEHAVACLSNNAGWLSLTVGIAAAWETR